MSRTTFASSWNADLIDANYALWRADPGSVNAEWRAFFEGFELARASAPKGAPKPPGAPAPTKAAATPLDIAAAKSLVCGANCADAQAQARVILAIEAFRRLGHTEVKLSPVHPAPAPHPELTPQGLGLDGVSPDAPFHTGDFLGGKSLPLRSILAELRRIYVGDIAAEFIHIQSPAKRAWIAARLEAPVTPYSPGKRLRMLEKIVEAETWERFMHTRFVGVKRFSLEGGEALMPALWETLENAPAAGVTDVQLGMAHRGRLNVLLHTAGKPHVELLSQIGEGYIPDTTHGAGDVKYHLGHSALRRTASGDDVRVTLAYNPSHLEIVDPVVLGKTRALQDRRGERKSVLPVLIHGDAAFIGQGVVHETFNMMRLKGFTVGGTLHIASNNQVGFTTDPEESRSSTYCTDLAKFVEVPVFHVNGDNPDAVVRAMEHALAYRNHFGEDAVVDIVCFRRHGHNETDEPLFTQPTLYREIATHPGLGEVYARRLLADGVIGEGHLTDLRKRFEDRLDGALALAKAAQAAECKGRDALAPFASPYSFSAHTAISPDTLRRLGEALVAVPPGFAINPKIRRQFDARAKSVKDGAGFDWAMGEGLAFGSILLEGRAMRLCGQDCERGTFSHRHAVQHDHATEAESCQLANLDARQGRLAIVNSPLSECAVLGFEYGYTLEEQDALVVWEAQFGDFANGAQAVIDQFLAAGESKWHHTSGLVLLLPHGYEGQGPEHSSARPERFLQLCADNNLQVCNLTTPAQLFHALRRQAAAKDRKPLVIFTPKSLLRHKGCVSDAADFTDRGFHEILADAAAPAAPKRLVLCSGKVFYDLDAERAAKGHADTAIVRVEQFHPLNEALLREVWQRHGSPKHVVWCQEEPANGGAWSHLAPEIERVLGVRPVYAGRPASAAPATGYAAVHKAEQARLIAEAFSV